MSLLDFLSLRTVSINRVLEQDIKKLSYIYPVAADSNLSSIIVKDFNLPPGYNWDSVSVLLELPEDYPESPPGVGDSRVYLPKGLRFRGRRPKDYHENKGSGKKWAWWCYEWIKWDPCRDDLIAFFELLRAHMTDPR
jgi:hypothetical protein